MSCSPNKDKKNKPAKVKIKKENNYFKLYRDGESFFIKGARTLRTRYMDKVADYGGNSVRIGYHQDVDKVLDKAYSLGLSVLFGLPIKAEREGFDYNDQESVREQYLKVKNIVETYKDHPAVLLWTIGNELDHIPGDKDYNLKLWDAVNDISEMIHEVDPDHPVMTVIGTGRIEKIKDLVTRCPDLDLLGVNSYADIEKVPDWLRKYNWNRPYVVTEWGPSGHWQVPQTKWGVVIEETSTEKAAVYKKRYENVIKDDPWCLGSYVFLWTSNRQERTHTWYNMFHDDGSEKGAVEVMRYEWTGEWPENRVPRLHFLKIDGMEALDNVNLAASTVHEARVEASDPDNDDLEIVWELIPENKEFGAYAGQGETKPEPVEDFIVNSSEDGKTIKFEVPENRGKTYRLFSYVYDDNEHVAVANIPFHVKED
ncbi:MAG: glycoside hydrolase family 2 TIM barrel-domain containing protein [bacterium]